VTGSAVQWLRDQLGIISGASEIETLASQVQDSGGMYFVPAFSGLFAPYWRADARGAIVGMSRFNTNAHLARATLEAICYQSRDVADAMRSDSELAGSPMDISVLKVDGGVTANDLCMQIQADILGVEVSRPVVRETTALGAAYAAGLATGFWSGTDELRENWLEDRRWSPRWSDEQRAHGYAGWQKAVQRTLDWVDVG
jgi:glycerol kinase